MQPFAYCSHCEDAKVIEIHDQGDGRTVASSIDREREIAGNSFFVPNAEEIDNVSIDLDLMKCIDELNRMLKVSNVDEAKAGPLHQKKVNYAHILSALEMTIRSMEAEKLDEVENAMKSNTVADFRIDLEQRKHQIELLWNNYRGMFPEEHEHMWSSLEHGLTDYLIHLKKRQQLHMDCDRLRRQNAQLKYMLQELL